MLLHLLLWSHVTNTYMVMELEGLRDNGIKVGSYFMFLTTKLLEDSLIMDFEKRLMTKSSSSTRETIQEIMNICGKHSATVNVLNSLIKHT